MPHLPTSPPPRTSWRAVAAVAAAALVLTTIAAGPVLRAPSERIFGTEIVGRHHDPFTVMAQFERPIAVGAFSQPLTDVPGALLARLIGPVASINAVVLLSFPLSAAAAFLLARYLSLSLWAAVLVALAFAFSPFHVAQAAYHPHVAQTQWIPLYLLALWRCLDAPAWRTAGLLAASAAAVALSNFYGGLIAIVLTPVFIAAHALNASRRDAALVRRVTVTVGHLVVLGGAGLAYAWWVARDTITGPAAFAFPRDDLFRYSATWWSYLVPPVAHPLLGDLARRVHGWAGTAEGLLEQQVTVGLALLVLAACAAAAWRASGRTTANSRAVPALVLIAAAALLCSLSPETRVGPVTVLRPSALIYGLAPMFRAYARFGVVVQLMVALLAGLGADWLWRRGTRTARLAVVALVVIAAGEYAVSPSALWRDVLPTAAHRWITSLPVGLRVADCAPPTAESASVSWLTAGRVLAPGGVLEDCSFADLPGTLAALGYTHLLVRRDTWAGRWFASHPRPDGLQAVRHFADSDVFTVAASIPLVYTAEMTGFYPIDYAEGRSWRWMGDDAVWTVVNATNQTVVATAEVEIEPLGGRQVLDVYLGGQLAATLDVAGPRRAYGLGPLALAPGRHALSFRPRSPATVADTLFGNGDRRALSCAFGSWRWVVPERR